MEPTLTLDQAKTVFPDITDDNLKGLNELVGKAVKKAADKATGEAYRLVDEAFSSLSGLTRDGSEKTTDFIARGWGEASKFKGNAETLSAKVKELEKQISEGKGDEAIRQQLKDANDQLAAAKNRIPEIENEWKEKISKKDAELMTEKLNTDFAKALSGVEFKETYSQDDIDVLVKSKQDIILAKYKPEIIDGKLVFRDPAKNNEVVPDDKLNPATGAYLLKKELTPLMKEGRNQNGGGSDAPKGKTNTTPARINATTKGQAIEQIDAIVVSEGLDRRKPEFDERVTALYKEFNVAALKD